MKQASKDRLHNALVGWMLVEKPSCLLAWGIGSSSEAMVVIIARRMANKRGGSGGGGHAACKQRSIDPIVFVACNWRRDVRILSDTI